MKKHLLLVIFVLLSALDYLSAQTTTVTFVGKSSLTDEYIRLYRVSVFNNSQHWEEILYYPDTILQLQTSTGIEEVTTSGSVLLLQNVPNPFDGVTDFTLQLEHFTQVEIEIYDINGRKVTSYSGSLDAGQHQFRATLTSPQTYLLSAQTSDQKLSIKMINEGYGADNSIIYLGSSTIGGGVSFGLRGTQLHSPLPFVPGDQMTYVGYIQVENTEYVSTTVQQQQWDDELIALMFNFSSPMVETRDVTVITASDAVVESEVLASGNLPVTARGVCWSTSQNPTIADSHTTDGNGTGSFSSNIAGLNEGTTYYVRAYATNNVGTSYGRDLLLNTKCKSVTDVDGITYRAVQIGEQCWMRENLRTDVPGNNGYPNAYGYANNWEYGRLYSWDVMMNGASSSNANPSGVQGICPDGWHVPSDAEWTQLTDYVSRQSEYCCGGNGGNIAKALASTTGWISSTYTCAVGNDPGSNNSTGFSALSAGYYYSSYNNFGSTANFWSATENSSADAYYCYLYYDNAGVTRSSLSKTYGYSVRCVLGVSLPRVTTANVVNITHTTASSGGEVTSDGGESVTARGVCWSTSHNPTIADSHTTDGSGTGSFSSSITGLTPNTTYYVRAYATNSVGTAYGEERSFTTNCGSVNVSISGNSSVNYGSSVTLTANGAYSYHWSTGANTASITVAPTVTTTYSVSGTDAYGCTGTATQTVTVNPVAPTVTTADFTDYNYTSVTSGGEVVTDGGANVTARGVCWSTSQNPTVSGSHTTDGSGTGSFSSNIGGLNEGTTYYVRAYATNSAGTSYGEEKQLRTWQSCGTVTDIDGNTYNTVQIGEQCWMRENLRTDVPGNNGYPNGDANNWEYGRLYSWDVMMNGASSSNANPSGVQGICPDGWHVPSDAEWTQLTDYVSSQSEYCCDGNSGNIAKALASVTGWYGSGNACAVGNGPSSNNATGFSALPAGNYYCSFGNYFNCGNGAYFWSATEDSSDRAYGHYLGYLYAGVYRDNYYSKTNGYSVRCVRGQGCNPVYGETSAAACGSYTWHGQTYTQSGDYTWTGQTANGCDSIVTLHLTIHPMPNVTISGNSTVNYGESVTLTASGADSYHWNTGATTASVTVAPTAATTYSVTGTTAAGCTGTASKTVTVNYLAPTVATADFSNYNYTSVTSGGEVTADGGANITARGVCWSTSPNPTTANSHTTDGSGTGSFTSDIDGLSEGTTYYVRAYATNSAGTSYGEEKQFRTWQSCGTVTDIDGNSYNTVQIGEQCWMRENLRTTKYADGTPIENGSTDSYDIAYWYYPNNSSSNQATYGLLYNWKAVMRNSSSSNANPSNVQGICPDGWHVPSDAEWTRLTDYVSSQSEYCCDGNSGNIAKALASTSGWSANGNACAVGNDPSSNNAIGFSALPAGGYAVGYNYDGFGYYAGFWSATESSSVNAYYRSLYYPNAGVDRNSYYKTNAYSVRCVRGQGCNPVYGETSAAACETYTWHGQTYTQSGDYTWTGTTSNGCDSIVTLHLTINNPTHVATTVTECESYVWNGTTYTQSGNYTFSHTDANGCAQVDTLHLTINQPTAETLNVTVTENSLPYHLNGYTYNAAGSYTQHLTNANGCDSTLFVNLTVLNNVSVSVDSTICDGELPLIWNGMTFNNAGSQSVTLTSANNTDSVVLMTLHVNASAYANEEVTLCESQLPFTWHGQTYTESGDHTWYGYTVHGCDSVVTLHLTINNPAHQAITVTECESYAWNGTTYTQSGHYTYSHVDANGCTQVDTLHLTIPPTTVFAHTADTIVPAGVPTTLWTSGANFILWKDSHGNVIGEENTITVYPDTITTYSVIAYNTGANLVTNGDFEQGNTGFSTSYIFANTGNYKHYFIGQDNHQMWSWDEGDAIFDHTSGSGNWMMVDAYSGYTVWMQTVNVQPNTDYIFSAWFVTDNIANVRFEINGVSGELFSTPEERGIWRRHHLLWNSGDNASAQLKIVSGSATSGGNDFGVDDISFAPITTCENTDVIAVTTLPTGDALPCMGHETVTDIDGNTYNTVQIGDQCWMRENLRTTRYADNSGIALGNANSYDIPYRYVPNNNSQNIPQYGYLYNWAAVMHGGHSNNDNPSGVQGICPDGWHVPSSNEWDQLISYVSSVPYYCCNGNSSYIVKALASQVGWNYQGGSCSVGSDLATNNLTGFSAMPACYFYDTHGLYFGRDASFWSCTQTGSNKSRSLRIYSPYSSLYYDINLDQAHGLSVRCIRGQGCNPVYGETSAAACESYTWNGQTYTQSGDYTWTGQTANGCDSVVTLHLTIHQPTTGTLDVTVTENSLLYHLNGYAYNAAGSYTQHLTNANGCDSTLFVNLTVLNNVSVSVDSTICDNDLPLIWNGIRFNNAGSQSITLTSANHTDSVVLMTLHVNESVYSNEEVTLCESQLPFSWHGTTYTQSGDYTWTGQTANGCDSIVTLHLTINRPTAETLNVTATENSLPYHLNGYNYNAAGSYTQHLTNAAGCDSTLTLNLTVLNNVSVSVDSTICDNDLPLIWNGIRFNNAGSQSITLTSANHTDSVVLMTLHVNESVYASEEATLCESQLPFSWHGTTYTQSGDHTWIGTTANGCDSIVTLHLTINQPTAETLNVTATENSLPYHLNGYTYNAAGSYTQHLTNANGCDSTLTLNLTVLNNVSVSVDSTICDGDLPLIWNGIRFNNAGSQSITLTSANHTDSVVLMTLHVNESVYSNEEVTLCESQLPFLWHGQTYTQSGDYTWTGTTANGCDSIVTLHLTINRPTAETLNVTATENSLPYHLNGYNYNAAGSYTQHLTNAAGCDSTLTLNLTVLNNVSVSVDSTICDNDLPLVWNGMTFNNAGSQSVTLTSANNTDSVVLMTLHVNASAYANEEVTLCESQLPFLWHGTTYTQSGDYTWTGQTANGCDSVVTLHLIIFSQPNINIEGLTDVCVGGQVTLTANVQNADGVSTYLWYRDSIDIYVSPEPTYTTEADLPVGSYLYSVEVANNICFSTASIVVTVHPDPEIEGISSSLQPSNQMCEGGTVDLGAPAIIHFDAADIQWHWFRNGAELYDEQIPTISQTLDFLGTYAYMVYVTQSGYDGDIPGCQSAPQHINIDVLPQPVWGPTYITPFYEEQPVVTSMDACQNYGVALHTSILGGVRDDAFIRWICAPEDDPNNWSFIGWPGGPIPVDEISSIYDTFPSLGTYIYRPVYESYSNNNCWVNEPGLLTLTVHENFYQDIAESACGSYTWNGQTYTESGDYTWHGTSVYGCDSIVTLHLTIHPMPNVQISGNSSVNYGSSVTLTANGAYSYHWSTGANTASITVAPTVTTTYSVSGTDAYGCTGTASQTVTVNPVAPTVTTTAVSNITTNSATSGGNVTSNGGANVTARGVCWSTSQNPTVSGSHTTDGSGTGSFSSSITGLTPNTTYYVRAYATNSAGTSYGEEVRFTTQPIPCGPFIYDDFNDGVIDPEFWTTTGNTVVEEDGMVKIQQNVTDLDTRLVSRDIPIPPSGVIYIDRKFMLHQGNRPYAYPCIRFRLNGSSTSYISINYWNTIYSPDSPYNGTSVFSDVNGQQTKVVIGEAYYDTNISEQVALDFNNGIISYYLDTLIAKITIPDLISQPVEFINIDFYGSGWWTGHWQNMDYVKIYNSTNYSEWNHVACDSYTWNGQTYTESGNYDQHFQNVYGCDSVSTLHLTIHNPVHQDTSATSCGSYTWHGQTHTQSGDYTWTGTTANGCDSIVTLHLTINNPTHVATTVTECESYVWNGTTYTQSGNYTFSHTDVNGCTQVDTLHLTIHPMPNVQISGSSSVNYGESVTLTASGADSYHWNTGANSAPITVAPTAATTYSVTGTTAAGCTGTASKTVTVNPVAPTVTTTAVSNITTNSATSGGNVTSNGGANVTARGVCWSTSQNPTVSDSHTTDGSGTGSFSSSITGLTLNTTYYVRAYATNSVGTSYGEEKQFRTWQSCGTVTDADGNSYSTVQIGEQCWMRENLRTDVPGNNGYPNGDANNREYGRLYSWDVMMNGASSSDANPSGVQGICPDGWHVPSYAEWTQLTDYVSSQSEFVCGGNGSNIAKALASTSGWWADGNACAVGNDPSSNNATGFSALPAGDYGDSYYNFGIRADFWSATENGGTSAYARGLNYNATYVSRYVYNKDIGRSVRCVRGQGCNPVYGETSATSCASYTWHGQTYTQSGDYTWTGQTSNGCDSIVTLHLTIHPMPNVQISGSSSVNYGSSITLTASGADSYHWNTGANTASVTVAPTAATTYSVTGTTAAGCTGTASINVEVNELTLNDGLVLYLPMNGDLMDVSGFANNGTNNGASLTTDRFCQPNSAYEFPGVPESSKIIVPNNSSLQFSDAATFSMWFCMNGTRGMDGWGGTVDVGCAHALFSKNSDMTCIGANVSAMPNGEFHIGSYSGRNSNSAGDTCELIQLNQWVQATFVYTTSYMEVYVNGELLSHSDGSMNFGNSNSKDLSIGLLMSTWYPFNGKIDEFRVYNRALNASEIAKLYYRDLIPKDSLVLFMPLDGNVIDHSDNNYQPVLHGNLSVAGDRFEVDSSAYYFPNDYRSWIEIPHSEQLNLSGTFTVSAWYNRAADGEYGNILSKGRDIESGWQLGTAGISVNGSNGYSAGIQDDLTREQWYMTTGVMDAAAGKLRYYLNGELMAETNCSDFSTSTTYPLAIGRHLTDIAATGAWAYPFKGSIDDIVIYHRALSDDEVMMLYNSNSHALPSCEDPIICQDTNVYIEEEACGSYTWHGTTYTQSGDYTWTGQTSNGCDSIVTLHLTIHPMPNVQISGSSSVNYGESVTLTASGADSYIWSTGSMDNPITVSPTSTTTYNVIGATTYGCTGTASKTVTVNPVVPTVTTTAVSNITTNSATSGGNVTSDGGANVTARGVCWSTSHNPTIADSHTTDGSGLGGFSSNITGLTPSTTYYVRAYATNALGTSYGEEKQFRTANLVICPNDLTLSASAFPNSVVLNWAANIPTEIITDTLSYHYSRVGGAGSEDPISFVMGMRFPVDSLNNLNNHYLTHAGVYLGTLPEKLSLNLYECTPNGDNVSIRQAYSQNIPISSAHSFSYNVFSLTCPYQIDASKELMIGFELDNVSGGCIQLGEGVNPVYSNLINLSGWTILDNVGLDGYSWIIDGYFGEYSISYRVFRDGTEIASSVNNGTYVDFDVAAGSQEYCYQIEAVCNGNTVSNTVCATTLPQVDGLPCVGNPIITDYDANTYSTVQIGEQCWMRENMRTTHYTDGTPISVTTNSYSTSTPYAYYPDNNPANASTYGLLYNWRAAMGDPELGEDRKSVCPTGWHIPSEEEVLQLNNYLSSNPSYWCGGSNSYVSHVLAANSGWSSSTTECAPGYDLNQNNATDMSILPAGYAFNPIGGFGGMVYMWTSNEIDENRSSYYEISADNPQIGLGFWANKIGGLAVRCLRDPFTCGTSTVTDIDGNTYSTVQIGEQCWMRENLRTDVPGNNGYPNGDANNWEYGRLYSWDVMMNGASSSAANPSGVQGICPDGWHVPSDAEWEQLEMAAGMSQSDADCSNQYRGNIAAKLSGNTGWTSSNTANAAGNLNAPDRNSTGFSALPAGRYNSSYANFGNNAAFWSATEYSSDLAYYRLLLYWHAGVGRYNGSKSLGYSVRCVRD